MFREDSSLYMHATRVNLVIGVSSDYYFSISKKKNSHCVRVHLRFR